MKSANSPVYLIALASFFFSGVAAAAPAQLYGKSVVVTWTENRAQKMPHETQLHYVARVGEFSVYVSASGRIFDRMAYQGGGARGRATGKSDQVGGEAEKGVSRSVQFQGQTMSMTMPMAGGARRILVSFEGGFSGCNAQVLTGKESGATKIRARSLVGGNEFEIHSIQTSGASCKISSGNVFGN